MISLSYVVILLNQIDWWYLGEHGAEGLLEVMSYLLLKYFLISADSPILDND
jgi:hypothetical protein